jgi:hypothetical protein
MGSVASPYDFPRSVSQRRTYIECGLQWYLRYAVGWKQKFRKAQWEFGSVCEQVANEIILGLITSPERASERLEELWGPARMDATLTYRKGLTWGTLRDRGKPMMALVFEALNHHFDLRDPTAFKLQHKLEYPIGEAEELGYLDCLGPIRREAAGGFSWEPYRLTVADFKTSDRHQVLHLAERDEQLQSYQLGVETTLGVYPEQLVLIYMLWGTRPDVQFLWRDAYTPEEMMQFRGKAMMVDQNIKAGKFYANDRACHGFGGCWAQPICFKSQEVRREAELVMDERKGTAELDQEMEL